jgi:hypothetical protein
VDMLSVAQEKTQVPRDALQEIRARVFSAEQAPPTKADVLKHMRQHDPSAFKPAPKEKSEALPEDIRKALLLSERLRVLLTQELDMPEHIGQLAEQLARALKTIGLQHTGAGAA